MSLETFKLTLEKMPKNIVVGFAGFCESFANKNLQMWRIMRLRMGIEF
jgi:hypothetical protein